MPASSIKRRVALPPAAVVAPAVLMAGLLASCSGTTYGTGVSPEEQTITDLMGIAALGGQKQAPIDYRPRGNIVAPPSTDSLPVPGSAPAQVASAAVTDPNWPKDPDQEAIARAEAKNASFGQPTPKFVLPAGQTSLGNAQANAQAYDAQRRAEGKAAWDELHKGKTGSVDANGKPVRKYLTEPPTDYREPDPNAPMSDPPKKKLKLGVNLSKLWPF